MSERLTAEDGVSSYHDERPYEKGGAVVMGFPYGPACQECWRASICPACGTHVELLERKDFESYSGAEYADHWFSVHDGKQTIGSRYLGDGRGYEPVVVTLRDDGAGLVERGNGGRAFDKAPDGCPLANRKP